MPESEWEKPQDEPLFMLTHDKAPEVGQAAEAARASLTYFRLLLLLNKESEVYPLVKTFFDNENGSLWLWLIVAEIEKDGFVAETFEAPPTLPDLKPGTRFTLKDSQIVDWMLNQEGTLHGGYSIRLQRLQMPDEEREKYDQYLGVTCYAPLPNQ